MRVSGIGVLLMVAMLPLIRCYAHAAHGPVGHVHCDLDRLAPEPRARLTVPDEAQTVPEWFPRIEHDRVDAIAGSNRVERLSGVVTVAAERPAGSIFAATQIPNGWLFASNDGVLYRAQTFTGHLVVVGTVPRELRFHTECYGRMALADDHGRWWTTDGFTGLEAVPMEEHALIMAFASSRRGVAVLQGGRLIATDDGGHTWRPVLTDLIAYNVSGTSDQLIVGTLDGMRGLLPDLTLTSDVHVPLPTPTYVTLLRAAVTFLRTAQRVHSLELPSGRLERTQELSVRHQGFRVAVLYCREGSVFRRPMPDVHGRLLGEDGEWGPGPAAGRVISAAGPERISITWRGDDAQGAYAHTRRGVQLPVPVISSMRTIDPLVLKVSTRTGVVFARDLQPDSPLWMGLTGRVTALPRFGAAPALMHYPSFQPLADGGVLMYGHVVLGAEEFAHSRFPYDGAIPSTMLVAQEVRVDGSLGNRIGVLTAGYQDAVIAVRNDGWGIAVRPPAGSDEILLYPSDHGSPRSLGVLPPDDIPACAYAQPRDATLLWEYGGDNLQGPSHNDEWGRPHPRYLLEGVRDGIEFSQSGTCLRRIEGPHLIVTPHIVSKGTLRLDARPGNILVGTVDDGTRVRSVGCSAVSDGLPGAPSR